MEISYNPKDPILILPGIIDINNYKILRWEENCILIQLDAEQKYGFEFDIQYPFDDSGDEFTFYIGAGEDTLNVKDSKLQQTQVLVPVAGDWKAFIQGGRYLIYIGLIRK